MRTPIPETQVGPRLRLRPGMRHTQQRQHVWDALHELEPHRTAEEIAAQVRLRHPAFSRSTVYRALEAMLETGEVTASRLDGGALRYELAESPHPHAVCEECGSVFHLDSLALQVARRELVAVHDFLPTEAQLTVRGICSGCRGPGRATADEAAPKTP